MCKNIQCSIFNYRYDAKDVTHYLLVTTFLDPRFKNVNLLKISNLDIDKVTENVTTAAVVLATRDYECQQNREPTDVSFLLSSDNHLFH